MTQYVIQRPPQNDLELWWAVFGTWGVKIPWTKVCDHHNSPFEAFADAYFARHPMAMWLGSRGFSGKTFSLSLLGMMELAYLGAFVSILGGSGAQATRVHESMTELSSSSSQSNARGGRRRIPRPRGRGLLGQGLLNALQAARGTGGRGQGSGQGFSGGSFNTPPPSAQPGNKIPAIKRVKPPKVKLTRQRKNKAPN